MLYEYYMCTSLKRDYESTSDVFDDILVCLLPALHLGRNRKLTKPSHFLDCVCVRACVRACVRYAFVCVCV